MPCPSRAGAFAEPNWVRAAAWVACALALAGGSARAQDASPESGTSRQASDLHMLDARTRLGGERIHLPDGERLGLVGVTELVSVGGEWWMGPGVYGAMTGGRGGLFVPGAEVAWSHPFNAWLGVDTGLFVGGGGGGNAPVGGGLMLRPHLDLLLHPLQGLYTGPTWSIVRFADGSHIDSRQFGWMFNFSSSFDVRRVDGIAPDQATDGHADGLGFDRVDATFTAARPHGTLHVSTGAPLTQTIGLVGMRAEHTLGSGSPAWIGIEAAGAGSGGVAGYAEVLGTAGLRWPVLGDRLSLGARVGLGAGGGGDIDTGGGMIGKADVGATLRVTDTLGVTVEGGLERSRNGHFDARTGSIALTWWLDAPHASFDLLQPTPAAEPTRMEFAAGVERYDATRKTGPTHPLGAGLLQINRFVTPHFYVTGQAHSALAGGAGAYSVGLFGVGTQWPVFSRVRVGAEALAGAAGGGGVQTNGGAIAQGRGYVDVALGSTVSLRVGAGRIRSFHGGGLDAPVVDAALVFRFGVDR
ncbi:MAG TPA: hypothetical protein VH328_11435, partial [Burkholderiaceae bacterium]|nr:hypothetical protein [Burkholderiaceae bacterium]